MTNRPTQFATDSGTLFIVQLGWSFDDGKPTQFATDSGTSSSFSLVWSFDDDKPTQFATDSGTSSSFSLVGALTMTGQRSLPRTVAPLHRSAWLEL